MHSGEFAGLRLGGRFQLSLVGLHHVFKLLGLTIQDLRELVYFGLGSLSRPLGSIRPIDGLLDLGGDLRFSHIAHTGLRQRFLARLC